MGFPKPSLDPTPALQGQWFFLSCNLYAERFFLDLTWNPFVGLFYALSGPPSPALQGQLFCHVICTRNVFFVMTFVFDIDCFCRASCMRNCFFVMTQSEAP